MVTTDFRVLNIEKSESPETFTEDYKRALETLGMSAMERFESESGTIPYQRITQELGRALSILFDGKSSLEEYKHDQPPMEALGCMVFAKMAGYFEKIEIRWRNQDKDPIAVGINGQDSFLICGWGDDKLTLEGFMQRARAVYTASIPAKIRQKISQARQEILKYEQSLTEKSIMDSIADDSFNYRIQYGYDNL